VTCSRRRQDLIVAGLFCVLPCLVYFYLWWILGHWTLGNDYPVTRPGPQLLFLQRIRDGFFPLWEPCESGGLSFAYYFFSGKYWPVTWLMYSLDATFNELQVEILTFVHLLSLSFSGFFTYLVMRRLGLGALAGIFAGVVFIFNFSMLDSFRYGMALDTAVWLPVMVYLAERIVAEPRIRLAAYYALAQYTLIVAGHMQKALYCIYFVNAYLIVRALTLMPAQSRRERCGWLARRAACWGGGQALGLGLCAVMLLPLFADVLPIYRTASDEAFRAQRHMTWQDGIGNVFYPWLADVHSGFYCAQIVWVLIAVAGAGLLSARKRTQAHPNHRNVLVLLFAVLLLCILYSLGPQTHAAEIINALLPFLDRLREPGLVMVVGTFCMAALSAFGIDLLLRRGRSWAPGLRVTLAGSLLYLIAGVVLAAVVVADQVRWKDTFAWLPLLGKCSDYTPVRIHGDPGMVWTMAVTIIGVALANLVAATLCLRRRVSMVAIVVALTAIALVEVRIYHRWGTWMIDHRYYTQRSERFKDADVYHTRIFNPRPFFMYTGNVTQPRDGAYAQRSGPDGGVRIWEAAPRPLQDFLTGGGAPAWRIYYQNVSGHEMPRAYVTPGVRLVRDDDLAAISRMDAYAASIIDVTDRANLGALDDADLVRLSEASADQDRPDARARFESLNAEFDVTEYTCNRVTFRVNTPAGGLLNYSDNYAAGWRATVDGREVRVYRCNHTFKAIVLPGGSRRVEFLYDPPSFRLGLVISLGSACLLVGLCGASFCRVTKYRALVGICSAALVAPGAWQVHQRIEQMVNRRGIINYDPNAPRQPAPDYAECVSRTAPALLPREDEKAAGDVL